MFSESIKAGEVFLKALKVERKAFEKLRKSKLKNLEGCDMFHTTAKDRMDAILSEVTFYIGSMEHFTEDVSRFISHYGRD